MVVARGCEEEGSGDCLRIIEFQFCQRKNKVREHELKSAVISSMIVGISQSSQLRAFLLCSQLAFVQPDYAGEKESSV